MTHKSYCGIWILYYLSFVVWDERLGYSRPDNCAWSSGPDDPQVLSWNLNPILSLFCILRQNTWIAVDCAWYPPFLSWNLYLWFLLWNLNPKLSLFCSLREKTWIAGDTLPIVFSLRPSNKKCLCSLESGFHFHNNPLSFCLYFFGKLFLFCRIITKKLKTYLKQKLWKAIKSVFVPPKVVFTITPFLSLEKSLTFSFCWIIANHRKGWDCQIGPQIISILVLSDIKWNEEDKWENGMKWIWNIFSTSNEYGGSYKGCHLLFGKLSYSSR